MYLYVLLLEDEKYYVGMTEDIGLRLWEHFKMPGKTGSGWTRKYHPVSVLHCSHHSGTMRDFKRIERESTLRLAKLKGFACVRGAGFSLTSDEFPVGWEKHLTDVPAADLGAMNPLTQSEVKQLMKGKYKVWRAKRREALEKQKAKSGNGDIS